MKERDRKFIANWENTREKGFIKYASTHGLGFGILIAITNLLVLHFTEDKNLSVERFIVLALSMILIGGITYAGVSWLINEYMYKKKIAKDE
jgi:uncharacterized membrane protein YvlD (DUF360 family)